MKRHLLHSLGVFFALGFSANTAFAAAEDTIPAKSPASENLWIECPKKVEIPFITFFLDGSIISFDRFEEMGGRYSDSLEYYMPPIEERHMGDVLPIYHIDNLKCAPDSFLVTYSVYLQDESKVSCETYGVITDRKLPEVVKYDMLLSAVPAKGCTFLVPDVNAVVSTTAYSGYLDERYEVRQVPEVGTPITKSTAVYLKTIDVCKNEVVDSILVGDVRPSKEYGFAFRDSFVCKGDSLFGSKFMPIAVSGEVPHPFSDFTVSAQIDSTIETAPMNAFVFNNEGRNTITISDTFDCKSSFEVYVNDCANNPTPLSEKFSLTCPKHVELDFHKFYNVGSIILLEDFKEMGAVFDDSLAYYLPEERYMGDVGELVYTDYKCNDTLEVEYRILLADNSSLSCKTTGFVINRPYPGVIHLDESKTISCNGLAPDLGYDGETIMYLNDLLYTFEQEPAPGEPMYDNYVRINVISDNCSGKIVYSYPVEIRFVPIFVRFSDTTVCSGTTSLDELFTVVNESEAAVYAYNDKGISPLDSLLTISDAGYYTVFAESTELGCRDSAVAYVDVVNCEQDEVWSDSILYVYNRQTDSYEVAKTDYITEGKIKESINGKPVTAVLDNSFTDNKNLRMVVLPASIELIADSAFFGCNNLKSVVNNSKLNVVKGSTSNGFVAFYADDVVSSIPSIFADDNNGVMNVFNPLGVKILITERVDEILSLPKGVYIVVSSTKGTEKIVVK